MNLKKYAIAAVAAASFALAGAAPASASIDVGSCTLHAYTPSFQLGGVAAHGRVDGCGFIEPAVTLQVCLQVQGPGGYGAYTKQETCDTTGPYVALSIDSYSKISYNTVRGHVYRTWTWTRVNTHTGWYTSSWWKRW